MQLHYIINDMEKQEKELLIWVKSIQRNEERFGENNYIVVQGIKQRFGHAMVGKTCLHVHLMNLIMQ